jgi:hypothetical protein
MASCHTNFRVDNGTEPILQIQKKSLSNPSRNVLFVECVLCHLTRGVSNKLIDNWEYVLCDAGATILCMSCMLWVQTFRGKDVKAEWAAKDV